jgi:outer membrane immunogenic protein
MLENVEASHNNQRSHPMNMQKLPLAIGFTAMAGLTATPAMAQDMYKSGGAQLYGGLNYSFVNIDADNGGDADTGTLSGKVGGLVTPYFGLEARGGFGVVDDTINGVDFSLDNFFGGYATLNLANESPATPYAILGFTRVEVEADAGPLGTTTDDDSDISYGLGVNVDITPELAGNLEYIRYYDGDDVTVDALGLGATLRF